MNVFHPLTKPWLEQIAEWLEDEKIQKALIGDTPGEVIVQKMQDGSLVIAGLYDATTGHVKGCLSLTHINKEQAEIALYCPGSFRDSLRASKEFARNMGYRVVHVKSRIDRIKSWRKLPVARLEKGLKKLGFDFSGIVGSEKGWYILGTENLYGTES